MKKFKYLFFILPFLFSYNVFAQNVTSSVRCSYNGSGSTYYGDPNDGFNSARCYSLGTRYSPRLGYIEFYIPTSAMSFTANTSYTVTMNMATNDWRNNIMLQNVRYVNSSGGVITSSSNLPTMTNFRFISRKQIKFNFKLPSGTVYPYLRFVLSSPTYGNPDPDISSSTYMTGDSNWNLSSIDISPVSTSSGSSSGGSSGGAYDDTGIISNNNQNTSDIINNNNSNTQDIINSNNISSIDSARNNFDTTDKNCGMLYKYNMLKGKAFSANGSQFDDDTKYYTNEYINLNGATKVVLDGFSGVTSGNIIIYDSNKNYLDFWNVINRTINLPTGSTYFRISTSIPSGRVFKDKGCTSKLDETNSYLMDDTDPNISDNEFTSLFDSVNVNNPLSSLLQLPVQFVNAIVNQSNSCQVVNLGTLLGVPISLPCIDIGSILGSTVWNTIDVLSSIGLIALLLKQLYESITNALTLGGYMDAKKAGLGYMSPLEFLCSALTGFGGDF